jgi:hypothetical protein
MKATRILLFLSPLLWFVPPLVPVSGNVGLELLNGFYRGMLGRFPGNALMAFLCYTYAHQIGREAWLWVCGSLLFPFFAPFVLAFMPAKYGSMADVQRTGRRRSAPAKPATGPFEKRFPLLAAYLATLPKASGIELRIRARIKPVQANFEFSAFVDPDKLDTLLAGAAARQLTVWTNPEDGGLRVFGAGMVLTPAIDSVTTWLRQTAPQRKVAIAVHPAESPTKFFEYYPSTD